MKLSHYPIQSSGPRCPCETRLLTANLGLLGPNSDAVRNFGASFHSVTAAAIRAPQMGDMS